MNTVLVRRSGPEHQGAPTWRLGMARAKLQFRGRLPGAFGFDVATASYRAARRGAALVDLLPMALPGSWMVNNKVPSPVFYRWLQPHARELWADLLELLIPFGRQVPLAQTCVANAQVVGRLQAVLLVGKGIPATGAKEMSFARASAAMKLSASSWKPTQAWLDKYRQPEGEVAA